MMMVGKALIVDRVQQYKSDVAFKTLVEGVNENLYYIPRYQRKFRWKLEQVQELIRSLIRGYPIPPIYAYRNRSGQLEILDGQQRVMSFFFYYIGKFMKYSTAIDFREIHVEGKTYKEVLEETYELMPMSIILNPDDNIEEQVDISYQNLPIDLKRKLDYTNITVIELRWEEKNYRTNDLQVIFKNLNRMGTLLEAQEIRNGVFDCAFYDMLRVVNLYNAEWRNIWGSMSASEEDMEFLLRLCTVRRYVDFIDGEFIINEYSGRYGTWMDKFSEEAVNMKKKEIREYEDSLLRFFHRFHVNRTVGAQKALLESLYLVNEKCDIDFEITDTLIKKIKNSKFADSTRQGTVKKGTMIKRWGDVYGAISGLD